MRFLTRVFNVLFGVRLANIDPPDPRPKVENIWGARPRSNFREDGTVYLCNKCNDVADIIIETGGESSCGAFEPTTHWGEGYIECKNCNIKESYSCSS